MDAFDPTLLTDFLVDSRTNRPAGTPAPSGRRRRVALSQLETAANLGRSLTVLSLVERGVRRLPVHAIEDYARAYGMSPARRDLLWRLRTGGYGPTGPAAPAAEAVSAWSAYLHAIPFASVSLDPTWQVREANAPWLELFASVGEPAPANLLEWLLWAPYARRLCADWRAGWITPLVRELRIELQHQSSPEMYRICARVRADRDLSALWRSLPPAECATRYNDGQLRLLRIPSPDGRLDQVHQIRLLVSSPAHNPSCRLMSLAPVLDIPAAANWRQAAPQSAGAKAVTQGNSSSLAQPLPARVA
jgi:hypothetical protein